MTCPFESPNKSAAASAQRAFFGKRRFDCVAIDEALQLNGRSALRGQAAAILGYLLALGGESLSGLVDG